MVKVFMTGKNVPVTIKSAHQGDAIVNSENDTLKVTSRRNGVFLFRWSAVDYVETEDDD